MIGWPSKSDGTPPLETKLDRKNDSKPKQQQAEEEKEKEQPSIRSFMRLLWMDLLFVGPPRFMPGPYDALTGPAALWLRHVPTCTPPAATTRPNNSRLRMRVYTANPPRRCQTTSHPNQISGLLLNRSFDRRQQSWCWCWNKKTPAARRADCHGFGPITARLQFSDANAS